LRARWWSPRSCSAASIWRSAGPDRWFEKDGAFDADVRRGFEAAHHAAARGEFGDWIRTAEGALALVILLDQFPRNLYRSSGHAYATDGLARRVAQEAVTLGHDRATDAELREFFYLPFHHAEDLALQDEGVALSRALGLQRGEAEPGKWAAIHREIIARFGRFPHRNRALGRATTAEEQAFLDDGGFAG